MSTGATFYFSSCCDGRARLGACITISQAPQHGFESWFGLKYAEQLMKCRAPLVKVKPVKIDKALEAAEKKAKDCAAAFANMNPNPVGAKQTVAYNLRKGQKEHSRETLEWMRRLMPGADGE